MAVCLMALSANCGSGQQSGKEGEYEGKPEMGVPPKTPEQLAQEKARDQWAANILDSMTLEEKIGQLYMVAAYSNQGTAHQKQIEALVRDQHIGGLIFMQGGPVRQARLTNRYQSAAKVPLMIAMDAEWGLGMRLKDSTISFPRQMTLGAIDDNQLIYDMGAEVAKHCRRLGIHVNFAPVVDVNSNPKNPVIGTRSFGENRERVALKGIAYTQGMQANRVMACAKHFPGHGDTDTDSHKTLPVLKHSKTRLDSMELYPFKRLIKDSVASIMVAHLHIPAYDSANNRPTTLSPAVVQGLLVDSLGYNGLVFTDALMMKGVAKYYEPGQADLQALLAGNTVLLFPMDVSKGVRVIKKAIEDNVLSMAHLDERVRKILSAKYELGLHLEKPIKTAGLYNDLNSNKALSLKAKLYEQAVTVVKNKEFLLPIRDVDSVSFAYMSIGAAHENNFKKAVRKYAPFSFHQIVNPSTSRSVYDQVYQKLKKKDIVFISLHKVGNGSSKGIHTNTIQFLKKLAASTKVVVTVFGNPYSLKQLGFLDYLVCGYEDDPLAHQAVPQVLFGAVKAFGKLPVSVSMDMPEGAGYEMASLGRLGYGLPEMEGLVSADLEAIDSICHRAIDKNAAPGCQVLVAKNGRVIYEKGFGYHTYTKYSKVDEHTVYDIASLTKVMATLQAVMILEGEDTLELTSYASKYLPELAGTNKSRMKLNSLLTHQAGLLAWLPLVSEFKTGQTLDTLHFSYVKKKGYPIRIAEDLYASEQVPLLTWKKIVASRLNYNARKYNRYKYLYSDLGFLILQQVVERVTGSTMSDFLQDRLYSPLGLTSMGYYPLLQMDKSHVPPTEMDVYFRLGLVHGYVHDPSAALLGGAAGNAGLFSDAHDIAVILQMHLQKGYYGGKQYLSEETVDKFNKRPFSSTKNRRGLGWDKPVISGDGGPTSDYAPTQVFGHTGFTGACAWADPKNQLVYIFLSNRIYPYAGNKRLQRENVRTAIQDVIYQAIGMKKPIR